MRAENNTFQASGALGSEYGKNNPITSWYSRLPSLSRIRSKNLLRTFIQTHSAIQGISASLGIDIYLHVFLYTVGRICPAKGGTIRHSKFRPKVLKDISDLQDSSFVYQGNLAKSDRGFIEIAP